MSRLNSWTAVGRRFYGDFCCLVPSFYPSHLNHCIGLGTRARSLKRTYSAQSPKRWHLSELKSRAVVGVSGADSADLLQGLITNDIHLLASTADHQESCNKLYTLMLNTQGRILFDLFISRPGLPESDGFLIDCDTTMMQKFIKHLTFYKLKKSVVIRPEDQRKVYAVFPADIGTVTELKPDFKKNKDPRLDLLGYRFITSDNKSKPEFSDANDLVELIEEDTYRRFRYHMGIPEGSVDLPPGECFPAESNADYLSGVHFHKGCYLGQELTARTHHTGVVRKRLMPVTIEGLDDGESVESGTAVMAVGAARPIGKLRTHLGKDGLVLFRINEALASDALFINNKKGERSVRTHKPTWWPEPH